MNGCIYRTEHNKCVLYSDEGRYNSFCDMENCKGRRKSNADRIREMTDEEIAELLDVSCDASRNGTCPNAQLPLVSCRECWLDWLRQEAKDG